MYSDTGCHIEGKVGVNIDLNDFTWSELNDEWFLQIVSEFWFLND